MRTLQQQLKEKGLSTAQLQEEKTEARPAARDRSLTDWELAELMGINRQTYRRTRGGAIRRR